MHMGEGKVLKLLAVRVRCDNASQAQYEFPVLFEWSSKLPLIKYGFSKTHLGVALLPLIDFTLMFKCRITRQGVRHDHTGDLSSF
jgi:hypothetical protein